MRCKQSPLGHLMRCWESISSFLGCRNDGWCCRSHLETMRTGNNNVVDRMVKYPSRSVHILIPGTCAKVTLTWQRGIEVASGIKVANQLHLRWRECSLDDRGGPNITTGFLNVGEGGIRGDQRERERCDDERAERCTLLALEREEGALSQGMWATSRSLERPGDGFSPSAPEGRQPH